MANDANDEGLTFSEAVGLLGQERSYAESGAALLKQHAPQDVEGRALYAQAKAMFDGLIEQLLADLAEHRDPTISEKFEDRIEAAVEKRVAFSKHVDQVLRLSHPPGAKFAWLDALMKIPAEVVKELFAGAVSIWREWRGASQARRDEIATLIKAQRWKPFAEIAAAT